MTEKLKEEQIGLHFPAIKTDSAIATNMIGRYDRTGSSAVYLMEPMVVARIKFAPGFYQYRPLKAGSDQSFQRLPFVLAKTNGVIDGNFPVIQTGRGENSDVWQFVPARANHGHTNAGIVPQLETRERPCVESDPKQPGCAGFYVQPDVIDSLRIMVLFDFKANRRAHESNECSALR